MSNEREHWALQVEAVQLWGAGSLAEAREKYEAAIALCPASHWALGHYRSGYAHVLAALGRTAEARVQHEMAVEHEEMLGHAPDSTSVAVTRYFLGLHCIREGDFSAALAAVSPSLSTEAKLEALLRAVQAQALGGLGRETEARGAARAALVVARSDEEREKLREELGALLTPGGEG
jgi:tetratricopeptide (TPR) repeat protein